MSRLCNPTEQLHCFCTCAPRQAGPSPVSEIVAMLFALLCARHLFRRRSLLLRDLFGPRAQWTASAAEQQSRFFPGAPPALWRPIIRNWLPSRPSEIREHNPIRFVYASACECVRQFAAFPSDDAASQVASRDGARRIWKATAATVATGQIKALDG
jgi:hypothetical protein